MSEPLLEPRTLAIGQLPPHVGVDEGVLDPEQPREERVVGEVGGLKPFALVVGSSPSR